MSRMLNYMLKWQLNNNLVQKGSNVTLRRLLIRWLNHIDSDNILQIEPSSSSLTMNNGESYKYQKKNFKLNKGIYII